MSSESTALQSIAEKKAELAEELRKLERQEEELREQQTATAFEEIVDRLKAYASLFTARQRSEIAALVAETKDPRKPRAKKPRREVPPKYWLPHSGDTWTGRGRMPRTFAAWEGSSSYNEWKKKHPDERFPAFPG